MPSVWWCCASVSLPTCCCDPVSHARAAIAGALVMLLAVWVMINDQSAWDTRDVAFIVLALLGVVLLLLGLDIRGRGRRRDITYDDEADKGQ